MTKDTKTRGIRALGFILTQIAGSLLRYLQVIKVPWVILIPATVVAGVAVAWIDKIWGWSFKVGHPYRRLWGICFIVLPLIVLAGWPWPRVVDVFQGKQRPVLIDREWISTEGTEQYVTQTLLHKGRHDVFPGRVRRLIYYEMDQGVLTVRYRCDSDTVWTQFGYGTSVGRRRAILASADYDGIGPLVKVDTCHAQFFSEHVYNIDWVKEDSTLPSIRRVNPNQ